MGIQNNSGDDALESWLRDLTEGETSVRRLRERLDAERDPVEDACPACSGTESGHTGHLPRLRSA